MRTIKKVTVWILIICSVFFVPHKLAYAASDIGAVNIPAIKQEQTNWCWAAATESILRYYGKSVSQTSVVQYVKKHIVNEGATDSDVLDSLKHWNLSGFLIADSISFSLVVSQINSGKPVYAGYTHSKGGHAVVIDGYEGTSISSSGQYIEYMDPAYGSFEVEKYSDFKSNGKIWDGTIYNINKVSYK